jgi:hypothetical protein
MVLLTTAQNKLLPTLKEDLTIKNETQDPQIQKDIELAVTETLSDVSDLGTELEIEGDTEAENIFLETARLHVIFRRKRKVNSPKANDFQKDWLNSVARLKKKLRSIRTNRSQHVIISKDPRDSKVPMPTMSSIYTFDNYV